MGRLPDYEGDTGEGETVTRDDLINGLKLHYTRLREEEREFMEAGIIMTTLEVRQEFLRTLTETIALLEPVGPIYDDYGIKCGACGYMFEGAPNYCPSCGREINWNASAREVRA